ncbi:MAG: hypothetical protein U5K51_14405 [Flavobacteriaceae bacterium]|nr:hypothetical protein [Flavobacteriaceae bacterium]
MLTTESLFAIPEDERSKNIYIERFEQINTDADVLNIRFKNALDSINQLTIYGNKFKFELQNAISRNRADPGTRNEEPGL